MKPEPKIVVPERDVLAASMKLLEVRGFRVERRNVVAVKAEHNGKRRMIRAGTPGASDLYGCTPAWAGSRHFELEVKRQGERPRWGQVQWLLSWHYAGAVAFWVDNTRTLDKVLAAVLDGWEIRYLDTTRTYTAKGNRVEGPSGDYDLTRGRSTVSC